jgi:hypothetical protein
MDRAYLRHQFLQHNAFLKKLYKQQEVVKTLNHATDEEVNLLLKLLHLLALGVVPLHKDHQDIIAKSKRERMLMDFDSTAYLRKALHSERDHKLKLLKQFTKLFAVLCHQLFNN